MKQVFLSHTKRDAASCDAFDRICARVGIKAFRSELETIESPPWLTIKDEINKSVALFLLVGKELATSQDTHDPSWRHTQNWIAYEIGVACQHGIDVWALCDGVKINFPMPYLNNYFMSNLSDPEYFTFARSVLEDYARGNRFGISTSNLDPYMLSCPYSDCKIQFHFWNQADPGEELPCPHCLRPMVFRSKHPPAQPVE